MSISQLLFGIPGLIDNNKLKYALEGISLTNITNAYSLRRLVPNYGGNIIRIRRASDNVEQDFGLINDELDRVSVTAFLGASQGYIVIWYDQSGKGNNATQAIAINQPQYVEGKIEFTQDEQQLDFTRLVDTLVVSFHNVEKKTPTSPRFLLGDTTLYPYYAGTSNQLLDPLAHAFVKNGLTRLNRTTVDPLVATFSSKDTVIFRNTGGRSASSISKDRSQLNRSWIGNYNELILSTATISDFNLFQIEENIFSYYHT